MVRKRRNAAGPWRCETMGPARQLLMPSAGVDDQEQKQLRRFWATSIALFRERFIDSVTFIHVLRGHPGGLLQFSEGEAVKICLAFDSSGIREMWPNRDICHAWTVAETEITNALYFKLVYRRLLFSFVQLTSFLHLLQVSTVPTAGLRELPEWDFYMSDALSVS